MPTPPSIKRSQRETVGNKQKPLESSSSSSISRPMYAAKPTKTVFDPWNSVSTGHQRAENRMSGSLAWRNSRTSKLQDQFGDKEGRGGKRKADDMVVVDASKSTSTWGDNRSQTVLRSQETLHEAFEGNRTRKSRRSSKNLKAELEQKANPESKRDDSNSASQHRGNAPWKHSPSNPTSKQIFHNLCFYINGSTFPIISDHKLKGQIAAHGGNISLHLGRRSVTHVIVGVRAGGLNGHGIKRPAGGMLAGGKIQKEITTTKSAGFRYVSVEWVMECLKRGQRVPEAEFAPGLEITGRGQRSALGVMQQVTTNGGAVDSMS